jgi:hypothetical protein
MNSTWQSLIWKEWHEHKWKLVSITAVLIGATALAVLASEPQDKLGLAFGMMFMCVVPLAVFVGLGIASNERSRTTLAFLQAQPVPMWHVGLTKLLVGLLTVVIPVGLTAFLLSVLRRIFDLFDVEYSRRLLDGDTGPINTGNFFVDITIFCSLIGVSLMIWSAAAGVNRKDEVSAGAAAATIILGWMALVWTVGWSLGNAGADFHDWELVAALSLVPCGMVALFDSHFTPVQIGVGICVSTTVHVLLAALYVWQFGRTKERVIFSPRVATPDARRLNWLDSPRRSPLTAVIWKQFRESAPIAAVGLAAIVGTATFMYAANAGFSRFADVYTEVSISLGCCVALVAGIGVALQDVRPQLNAFWRSRPIDGNLWFWTKFFTGLGVVAIAIYTPLIWLGFKMLANQRDAGALLFIATLHVSTYAAAVAMTCLVRHAVYAAILSLGALMACIVAVWLVWMIPTWIGGFSLPDDSSINLLDATLKMHMVVTGTVLCLVLSTITAWLAMRNDWGLKSRF